jgi:hypothetical protein
MLIDKGVSAGEIVSLKLTSGEELVAKLIEETSFGYKLSKPMVLSMGPQGIGMVPMMFTVDPDKEVLVKSDAVMVITVSDRRFADQYIQGTTGIKLA